MYATRETIILASGSPRRKQYMLDMGIDFTVQTAAVDERIAEGEGPDEFVLRMAREKAQTISAHFPECWIVSGDTIVCLDDTILGKPTGDEHAVEMLMMLSGREHTVKTGFCVANRRAGVMDCRLVATRVMFAPFSRAVARAYVATGEPLDKAGAYGIQGKGGCLVKSIEGSYSNVVGLPLHELLEILQNHSVITPL
jgi:septum formation protein